MRLGGIQLEDGSVRTPLEQRPIGLELSLCSKFTFSFYASFPIGASININCAYADDMNSTNEVKLISGTVGQVVVFIKIHSNI